MLQRAVRGGHVLCQDFDLVPLVVGDAATGGATDAQHFICFGRELTKRSTPVVEAGLRRTVRHVLDGGVEGHFPTVLKSALPELSNPARAVLWHNNILRPEGLFPSRTPDVKVYCPSHKLQDSWTIRSLTISEKLQLYQLPLSMDAVLTSLFPNGWLPFADSPSPEVYTSILRQLWGDSVGGGTFVLDLTDESGSHFLEGDEMKEEKVEMDKKDEKADIEDDASDDLVPSLEGTDTSVMTAETPDTAFSSPPISYHFEFDCDFGGSSEGPLDDDTLTDDDTPPSDASAETCWMRGWRGQEGTLEEHEIRPGPK